MTLMPVEEIRVGWLDPADEEPFLSELLDVCGVLDCTESPEPGSHHIVPRSKTAGPRRLVTIDGLIVGNRVRLCHVHHVRVTGGIGGHSAKITWDDDRGWLWHEIIRKSDADLLFGQPKNQEMVWSAGIPLRVAEGVPS